jgi:preprotein translocase subunit SecG
MTLVGVLTAIFNTLIVLASLFLICLILIQRGKGGGLAGAFGGVGGSSAFGTKAGDTFTKITVVTAAVWILMAMLLVVMTSRRSGLDWGTTSAASASKTAGKAKSTASGTSKAPASGNTTLPAESPASSGAAPAIPPDSSFPVTPGSEPNKP